MDTTDKPLVSVIIPLYNAEKYFSLCIESVISQTYNVLEIIVVDDKSPDLSGKIADAYASSDSRIKVIHKTENQGLNRARQTGFENSRGSLITFVDSDDMIQDNFIERMVDLIEGEHADIAVSGYHFFIDESKISAAPHTTDKSVYGKKDTLYYMLTSLTYWPHPNSPLTNVANKMFQRKIFAMMDWDFCDYSIGEDDFCSAYFFNCSEKNVVTDEQIYYYRKGNPTSLTADGTYLLKYKDEQISVFELCNDFLNKVTDLLGQEHLNEVRFRAYSLYKYYAWSQLEYKHCLSDRDIYMFDRHFPAVQAVNIKGHDVNTEFYEMVEHTGIMGYVNTRVKQLQDYLEVIEKHREVQVKYYQDKAEEQQELYTSEYSRMTTVRGSFKRLFGNISRYLNNRIKALFAQSTMNQKRVDHAIEKRLKPIYDDQSTVIPKIIHYCWMGGKTKPADVATYIESWKKHLPEYEIIEWNESNFDVKINRYAHEAYVHKKWAFVSDYVRLEVLSKYGGIYLDADIEILKPLDCFLNHKAFSGFESGDGSRPHFLQTGLMASKKGGAWIEDLRKIYEKRSFVLPDGQLDLLPNPTPVTEQTVASFQLERNNTFQDLGEVVIYPSEYFCPKNWQTKENHLTNNSYAIHHFAGTWLDSTETEL